MTKQKNKAPEGFPKKDWDKLSETWKTTAQSKQTKELEKFPSHYREQFPNAREGLNYIWTIR